MNGASPTAPAPRASVQSRRLLATAFLFLLPVLVFHRALLGGEAFLPADLLVYLFPWHAGGAPQNPWNVLRFDGITQFYPWRLEAARQIASGQLPLWNTYSFGASGGTPLLANSQSAPLYPPNLLFVLFYRLGAFWYAWGLSAALHLALLATGMYRLLRGQNLRRVSCVLGSVTLALSAPVVCWLALPTFLAVSAYLPWLCLAITTAHQKTGTRSRRLNALGAALCIGLMLLAGHLQIAVYSLIAAGLWTLWHGHVAVRLSRHAKPAAWAGTVVAALALGITLSLAQVLPVLALGRVSSRALAAPTPTWEGYQAFVASAFPMRSLVTLLVPDFFGHPNHDNGFYWNSNNYGEWAAYVGVVPLLLAFVALVLPWRKAGQHIASGHRALWALTALAALGMAMGTWLNIPFFFLVPGFHQFGNPGRILIVLAFALSGLAAHGLNGLLDADAPASLRRRAVLLAVFVATLVGAIGLSASATFAGAQKLPFGNLLAFALPSLGVALLLLFVAGVSLIALTRLQGMKQTGGAAALILLAVVDLAIWGYGYNPTARPSQVYPVTPGIAWLQTNAKNALIAPLNRGWSIGPQGPQNAVLPPNALTVYGLHDIQGYDSLFPDAAKAQVKDAGSGEDPSPPENGNIVFVKQVQTALSLGAQFLIVPPTTPDLSSYGVRSVYTGEDMIVYENRSAHTLAPPSPALLAAQVGALRIGSVASVTALVLLIVGTFWASRAHNRP